MEGEVAKLRPRFLDDGHGLWLAEAGQVKEVGFLAEREEDGPGAILQVGPRENGHGIVGQAESQLGAPIEVFLGGDAGCYCNVSLSACITEESDSFAKPTYSHRPLGCEDVSHALAGRTGVQLPRRWHTSSHSQVSPTTKPLRSTAS